MVFVRRAPLCSLGGGRSLLFLILLRFDCENYLDLAQPVACLSFLFH